MIYKYNGEGAIRRIISFSCCFLMKRVWIWMTERANAYTVRVRVCVLDYSTVQCVFDWLRHLKSNSMYFGKRIHPFMHNQPPYLCKTANHFHCSFVCVCVCVSVAVYWFPINQKLEKVMLPNSILYNSNANANHILIQTLCMITDCSLSVRAPAAQRYQNWYFQLLKQGIIAFSKHSYSYPSFFLFSQWFVEKVRDTDQSASQHIKSYLIDIISLFGISYIFSKYLICDRFDTLHGICASIVQTQFVLHIFRFRLLLIQLQ